MTVVPSGLGAIRNYVQENFGFSAVEVAEIMRPIRARGDRVMAVFLYAHAGIAFLLAFFYDTWLLTAIVTTVALTVFRLSVTLLPAQFLTRCVAGVALQAFVALHIYQLHGLAEMHFFFFTAFTMMLVYQDWLCMWPGTLLIISQHTLFAILQNSGVPLGFFAQSYVGFTQLFFHFVIACVHVAICGGWAVLKKRQTLQFARQEGDLRLAIERAEEAAQTKSAFWAMMSHEIRTPMNAVMGMTQLLLGTSLTAPQREYAESARRGADGLLRVINDVLDFSKMEAGKVRIDATPIQLRTLLSEVIQLMLPGARQKGIELVLSYPADAPEHFSGDGHRIRQIAFHLVSNAIKYTERGSVTVRVSVEYLSGLPDVTIAVVDTGAGIPAELQPMLFREFNQLDCGMARKHGGTGLGLAISKKLAGLMGGQMGVESEVGKGSTFWFRLPLDLGDEAVVPELADPRDTISQVSNANVLLAEDNAVNRRVAVAFLHRLGCAVETAENGSEAIRMWQYGHFDMILMDCHMPEVDGYMATKIIRSKEKGSSERTPIIAMTAHAMPGDRETCMAAGMDDYLSKPVDIAQLASALLRWSPTRAA